MNKLKAELDEVKNEANKNSCSKMMQFEYLYLKAEEEQRGCCCWLFRNAIIFGGRLRVMSLPLLLFFVFWWQQLRKNSSPPPLLQQQWQWQWHSACCRCCSSFDEEAETDLKKEDFCRWDEDNFGSGIIGWPPFCWWGESKWINLAAAWGGNGGQVFGKINTFKHGKLTIFFESLIHWPLRWVMDGIWWIACVNGKVVDAKDVRGQKLVAMSKFWGSADVWTQV
jgi:hypothetical protein